MQREKGDGEMKPTRVVQRTLHARSLYAAVLTALTLCAAVNAQQQPPRVTGPTTSSVQAVPRSTGSPYGNAVGTSARVKLAAGAITGFVYWQMNVFQPQADCQGLTVKIATVTKFGMPLQLLATTSTFTPMGPATDYSALGNPKYMRCSYSFHNMPENIYLRALLYGQPTISSVAIPAAFQIPGGNCTNGPPSTLSFMLTGGEMLCGDGAFNINFKLTSTAAMKRPATTAPLLAGSGKPSGLLSKAGTASDLDTKVATPDTFGGATPLPGQTNAAGPMTSGTRTGLLTSAQSSGGENSTRSIGGAGGLNGGTRVGDGSGGFNRGTRPALRISFTGGMRVISGRRVQNALTVNSSTIAVLRQQKQVGTLTPGHTLDTVAGGSVAPIMTEPPNARLTAVSPYVPSNLLTAQQNAWCAQWEAQGGAPAIFSVAGKDHGQGVVYSPDVQANPYAIVGCAFGGATGSAKLELGENTGTAVSKPLYVLTLAVQSWNDHQIIASLDPNTSHVPDWSGSLDVVYTAIQSATGRTTAGPAQFYARRQTVLLSNVPQNEASLYQQGTPYFLSPVTNYYGLNGTVGVMRQGLAPNAVAGQGDYMLQLSPGFIVDSTQTDLLVSNTSPNVTSQSTTVNGNNISVTSLVLTAGSGNSTNYYSIYGLKIWVTGPAGVPPVTPAP